MQQETKSTQHLGGPIDATAYDVAWAYYRIPTHIAYCEPVQADTR